MEACVRAYPPLSAEQCYSLSALFLFLPQACNMSCLLLPTKYVTPDFATSESKQQQPRA